MYTRPNNIVKTGVSCRPYVDGQQIACIYACISYTTGLPLYYRVSAGHEHNFLTFEEAMMFCDINGYWVDTKNWGNPIIGITKFYSPSTMVQLDDGRTIEIGD